MRVKISILVVVLLILVVVIAYITTSIYYSHASLKTHLTVHVIYLLDGSTVTGATVEAMSSDGNIVSHQPLNSEGIAVFELPPGRYIVRMTAGYTGWVEIDLRSDDKEVILKVIPVFQ